MTRALFDGRYEIIEPLGASLRAEIVRAYHRQVDRYVALKILRAAVRDDLDARASLAREARALAAVHHPALPEVFDCCVGHDEPYLVMTLVRGQTAAAIGRLNPCEVLAVGQQLADGLAALHERGILHRDINRANILIDLGRRPRATLIDLGAADFTDRFWAVAELRYLPLPEDRVAVPGGGVEQQPWSAPEVRAGKGWTERSDVWSLALQLYTLLTGKRPFGADETEMAPPQRFAPRCPRALAQALVAALHRDPERRPAAHELQAALAEADEELREEDPPEPAADAP